jgi:16S rRNA (uracil1498-N3)-methyltransferase
MHLFYDPTIDVLAKTHILNEEESKHACKVMRLVTGNEIAILNGKGIEFIAKIIEAHPKHCKVEIISKTEELEPNYDLHIAIAPTKIIDRIEWFLEKATEIGITEITPLICSNSERKIIKEERLEKILIAAMKQSKRLFLPKLNPLTEISSFIKQHPKGLIAHCYEGDKASISEVFETKNSPILIGPEGDFSMKEVEIALNSGYKTITLGKNRLRTETAGLYAVMQGKMNIDLI